MRRDSYRLEMSNVAWLEAGEEPRQPTLAVHVVGEPDAVRERFAAADHDARSAGDVDVTFRFQGRGADDAERGVLAIANRVTGEFLVEVNAGGADVRTFVTAARRYAEGTDDAARYRVRVLVDDEPLTSFEKRTLLVYSSEGELLRQHSLIPSGVEI